MEESKSRESDLDSHDNCIKKNNDDDDDKNNANGHEVIRRDQEHQNDRGAITTLCNWCLLEGRFGREAEEECARLRNAVAAGGRGGGGDSGGGEAAALKDAIRRLGSDSAAVDKELIGLVGHGASWDHNLLLEASRRGAVETLRGLIKIDPAMVNRQSSAGGWSASHRAAAKGRTECLRLLKENGKANFSLTDSLGCSPAYYAAEGGHAQALEYILQHEDGAGPEYDRCRRTKAHYAAMHDDVACLEVLHAAGALQFQTEDREARRPVDLARAFNRRKAETFLVRHCPHTFEAEVGVCGICGEILKAFFKDG